MLVVWHVLVDRNNEMLFADRSREEVERVIADIFPNAEKSATEKDTWHLGAFPLRIVESRYDSLYGTFVPI